MAFTTKKSLLAKVRAGDEVSWNEFYEAYRPLILLCGGDCSLTPDENEELVQQVMTELFTKDIIGKYDHGNFETTDPLTLSVPHADATGALQITDGKMSAQFYLVLRGTAPEPAPIDLEIAPNGERTYSLSEIMQNFDPAYMRQFVKNHNRF